MEDLLLIAATAISAFFAFRYGGRLFGQGDASQKNSIIFAVFFVGVAAVRSYYIG